MTGKTYFNYGSHNTSKGVAEAISLSAAPGPLCGFGSATINNNNILRVFADGGIDKSDPLYYLSRDLRYKKYLSIDEDSDNSSYAIRFAFICRDGILYRVTGEDTLEIPIEGTKSSYNQVFLFAEHTQVTEAVDNQPNLRAFWNTGITDFYDLYKRSQDIYYPISQDNRKPLINDTNEPLSKEDFTYKSLIEKVMGSCDYYRSHQKSMVLLGIYGTGTDGITNKSESFALVPYQGQFPLSIPYNEALHSYLTSSIKRLENWVGFNSIGETLDDNGDPITFSTLFDYMMWYINKRLSTVDEKIAAVQLPKDTIVLFAGSTANIPKGWAPYNKADGRIVIGYKQGGITLNTDTSITILKDIGEQYDPDGGDYVISIAGKDLPKHYHGIGQSNGRQDNAASAFKPIVVNFNERDKTINGRGYMEANFNRNLNLKQGACLSGANITQEADPNTETSKTNLYINKLLPAITLQYIIKTE